jgi:hypothetical protein
MKSFPGFTWNYHLTALSRAIKFGAIMAKAVQNSRHRAHSTLQQRVRISSYSSILKVSVLVTNMEKFKYNNVKASY